MTDHTDLMARLREHAENMYVDFLNDAADALEAQAKRIDELEQEIDDYETTYKGSVVEAQAKRIEELHNQADMNGRLLTENAELRERIIELEQDCEMRRATNIGQAQTIDGYAARIAALEAALKPFADRATYADKYSPDREQMPVGLDELRAARAAMEGKDD